MHQINYNKINTEVSSFKLPTNWVTTQQNPQVERVQVGFSSGCMIFMVDLIDGCSILCTSTVFTTNDKLQSY